MFKLFPSILFICGVRILRHDAANALIIFTLYIRSTKALKSTSDKQTLIQLPFQPQYTHKNTQYAPSCNNIHTTKRTATKSPKRKKHYCFQEWSSDYYFYPQISFTQKRSARPFIYFLEAHTPSHTLPSSPA